MHPVLYIFLFIDFCHGEGPENILLQKSDLSTATLDHLPCFGDTFLWIQSQNALDKHTALNHFDYLLYLLVWVLRQGLTT